MVLYSHSNISDAKSKKRNELHKALCAIPELDVESMCFASEIQNMRDFLKVKDAVPPGRPAKKQRQANQV